MTVEELKEHCRKIVESGSDFITLVLPKGVRLCGRRGPIGKLLSDNERGKRVVGFSARAVLKFIEKEEARDSSA